MIADTSDGRFDELWSIYQSALPARERKSRAALDRMVERDDYRFLVAISSARVVGFAIVFVSAEFRFALLEYMAVDPEWRGRGIGSAMLDRVRERSAEAAISGELLIEVDSDREVTPDRQLRARRKAFYRHNGCREIAGLDYILPLPGLGPPPMMNLMICSAEATGLPRTRVRSWLIAIYTQVYGSSAEDPRIDQMMGDSQDAFRLV